MNSSISKNELFKLLCNQLNNFFGISDKETIILKKVFNPALKRSFFCFSKNKNKYYQENGKTYFNPYHSGQNCIFLYFISNMIFKSGRKKRLNKLLADKIYYLNKTLNGLDLFYEVEMPKIFILDHPLGSIIGRGKIKDYFFFSSGCVVGNNKGIYPKIGKNVRMLANSKILGNCIIGDNVIFAPNSYVIDTNIPNNVIVFGQYPNNVIKKNTKNKKI